MQRPLIESFWRQPPPEADQDVAGGPSHRIDEGICDGRGAASVMPNLALTVTQKYPSLKLSFSDNLLYFAHKT